MRGEKALRHKIGKLAKMANEKSVQIELSTFDLQGIERFRTLAPERAAPGFVLYNGAKTFRVRDVRATNPLQCDNLWRFLVAE